METETSHREQEQIKLERARVPVHYDHEKQIFEWVLGHRMAYSTGIWLSDDDTLDTAQERKCRIIASRLALGPGSLALDVGCGWGSVLLYLAEHTAAEFHGVTLSTRQRDELLRRTNSRCRRTHSRRSVPRRGSDAEAGEPRCRLFCRQHRPHAQPQRPYPPHDTRLKAGRAPFHL